MLFSVWAVPQEPDRQELSALIQRIGKAHGGSIFLPHMTLYACHGMSQESVAEAIESMKKSVTNVKPFELSVRGVGQSEEFFKCAYLELQMSDTLQTLFRRLDQHLSRFCQYTLKPHLSLLYKDAVRGERQRVIASVKAPRQIPFNEIGYVIHDPQTHRDVSAWRYNQLCRLKR